MRVWRGMRCNTQRAAVIRPSQPSFCTPGRPDKNLSVTSLPRPILRNPAPSTSRISVRKRRSPAGAAPSDHCNSNRTRPASWILPMLCSRRVTSSQLPSGSTIRHQARLSKAVPQSTAFLPPAFIATLPPTQEASAEVGSTANTKPASSAASETRLVTTPAPARKVATGSATPGNEINSTAPRVSSFSVLMTAERQVSGMAPPV